MPTTVVIVASDRVTEEQFKQITDALQHRYTGGDVVIREGLVKEIHIASTTEPPINLKFVREDPKPEAKADETKPQEGLTVQN